MLLSAELDEADVVVMIAASAASAGAASVIRGACALRGVMTAGLVLDEAAPRTAPATWSPRCGPVRWCSSYQEQGRYPRDPHRAAGLGADDDREGNGPVAAGDENATLDVPGQDESHATSAPRYLQECLASSRYRDVPVTQQTQETLRQRLLDFLASASASETSGTGTGAATPA